MSLSSKKPLKVQQQKAILPEPNVKLIGQYCNVLSFDQNIHGQSLADNVCFDYVWDYLSISQKQFKRPNNAKELLEFIKSLNWPFFVIQKKQSDVCYGTFSLMCSPQSLGVQLRYVMYNKQIQRSIITTEAFYLITKYAFQNIHYNRYQWRCSKFNRPSISAAERFGFQFDGILRSVLIRRGTYVYAAYFSILKRQWNIFKQQFQRWLNKDNFNENGEQKTRLRCKQIRQKLNQQQLNQ